MSDEAIHKAVDAARTFLQNDAERLAYINRELAILDITRTIAMPLKKGKLRDVQKGLKKVVQKNGNRQITDGKN